MAPPRSSIAVLSLFLAALLALGCGGAPPPAAKAAEELPAGATTDDPLGTKTKGSCPPQGKINFTGGDGATAEAAIIVHGANGEKDGVNSEYECLDALFGPGAYKVKSQGLVNQGKRAYDVLHVVLADGTPRDVWFDITEFFGKGL